MKDRSYSYKRAIREANVTRRDIRTAIDDIQSIDSGALSGGQRTLVDEILGLFYEAFAQDVLTEHRIMVDINTLCGFRRYAR